MGGHKGGPYIFNNTHLSIAIILFKTNDY